MMKYAYFRYFVKVLEKYIPSDRICLEWKNFEAGCPEAVNIFHAVENSRCTLVFVTESYLRTGFNRLHLFAALLRTLHEKRRRLIVVRLEKLKTFEVVPSGWKELADWLDSMPTLYWSMSSTEQTEILEELLDCLKANDQLGCSHIINKLKHLAALKNTKDLINI